MLVSALMTILVLLCMPLLLGMLITRFLGEDKSSLLLTLPIGFVIMLATFQLISIPLIWVKASFESVFWPWLVLMVLLCLVSMWLNRERIWKMCKAFAVNLKKVPFMFWVAVALIAAQAIIVSVTMHLDEDDVTYVVNAQDALRTNTMFQVNSDTGQMGIYPQLRYMFSSYSIFCAAISKMVDIHPAILMHTVFPLFLITLAYIVYYLTAKKLFKEDMRKIGVFMVLVCLINIFGNYSIYTASSFLLFRIWQGKAIMAAILLPFILYLCMRVMWKSGTKADWILLFITMIATCTVTSLGVALGGILLGVLGIVFAIMHKNVKTLLYAFICALPCVVYGSLYLIGHKLL